MQGARRESPGLQRLGAAPRQELVGQSSARQLGKGELETRNPHPAAGGKESAVAGVAARWGECRPCRPHPVPRYGVAKPS